MAIEFETFIRRPFKVQAVKITLENMDAVADLIGEVKTEKGVTFIAIDRRIVPNVSRAFAGWYMTRFNDNYRCYRAEVFDQQFVDKAEVLAFQFQMDDDEFEEEDGYVYEPEGNVEGALAVE